MYNTDSMDMKNKIVTVVGAVALIAATGVGGYTLFATKDSTNDNTIVAPIATSSTKAATSPGATTAAVPTTATAAAATASPSSTAGYKDGVYVASSSYTVPEGDRNTISATVVISGGTIASVVTTHDYANRESGMYIDSFDKSLTAHVKNKSIADYSPSRIGGASLTTAAFSNVLDTVRAQAKA